MDNLEYTIKENSINVKLSGHVDSGNAPELEAKLLSLCSENPKCAITIDCANLKYISSAGLRIVLKLKKQNQDLKLINVSSEVYEIFDMTGFTQMIDIHKAFKTISVEGCEVIGSGANGTVYRIDPETIVKTFMDEDALQDIEKERALARTAFVQGVPTAISYDVVKLEGGGYGSVYELLKADNFANLLKKKVKSLDELVQMSVDLLKIIHSKEVDPDSMPCMKERALGWAIFMKDHLPSDQADKLLKLFAEIPEDNHMIHGDFHLKNIMYQDGEALLIDMDTLSHGHPIFEFASIYNAYLGFSAINRDNVKVFLGIPYEQAQEVWEKTLKMYFSDKDEKFISQVQDKAALIGFTRLARRAIRRDALKTEEGRAFIECAKRNIAELLSKTDSLFY